MTILTPLLSEKYPNCTVLFSDIVTFTDITVKCQADQVVSMLNDLFHRFDNHTDTHDVHKVIVCWSADCLRSQQ